MTKTHSSIFLNHRPLALMQNNLAKFSCLSKQLMGAMLEILKFYFIFLSTKVDQEANHRKAQQRRNVKTRAKQRKRFVKQSFPLLNFTFTEGNHGSNKNIIKICYNF